MRRPIIGVTPEIEVLEGNPSRPFYLVDARLDATLRECGCASFMLAHDAQAVDAFLDAVDGVLVSGGGYQFTNPERLIGEDEDAPAIKRGRLAFEWALVERAIERDIPVLGICGGFQVMNAVLGGRLVVNLENSNPALAHHRTLPYDRMVHDVTVHDGTLLSSLVGTDRFAVNSLHSQGVLEVGERAMVAAISDDGVVEAIEARGRRFCLGVQWHPEFLLTPQERRLFRGFAAACGA